MGSPITFSGFNSIDFNAVLNAVMTQERTPLTRLETQKKTLETQNTAFATLATKLAALDTAATALKDRQSLGLLKATSSDAGVGVSTTSGTVTGTYAVVVNELARSQVTASQSTYGSLTSVVATGGTFTLTGNGDTPVNIAITGSTTLEGLATAINANVDSPATASVVQTAPGSYKLVLNGKDTGAANSFTVSNTLTGGLGVAFIDTDADGVSGDSALDNSQVAIDAAFTVNGLPITSSSNTVTDVVAGVTLSLNRRDPATTVTVGVTRDNDKSKDLVKKFATAYNDIVTFAKDQSTAAIAGKASIGRDPLLRGLREGLRQASLAQYGGGTATRLAEIGLGFDISGKMVLDDAVFDNVMRQSPTAIQTLLSGTAGNGGAFGAMSALIDGYTDGGGLVATARQRIDAQVSSISKRLDTMEANLALRRASLQREYTAADLAMTRLNAQSSSLSSIGSGYRLF